MSTFQVNPLRIFKVGQENCKLECAFPSAAVGNNKSVVTGVAAKKIRVMGLQTQSVTGAVGTYVLKSASGGTFLCTTKSSPPNTYGDVYLLPINEAGYFETNTGEGLFCDIVTADVNLDVFYIIYTPQ